jgi:hypothetical protein
MIITHNLEIFPRDIEEPKTECLCDKQSGHTIINQFVSNAPEKKFFITFRNLFDNKEERIGLKKINGCYSLL